MTSIRKISYLILSYLRPHHRHGQVPADRALRLRRGAEVAGRLPQASLRPHRQRGRLLRLTSWGEKRDLKSQYYHIQRRKLSRKAAANRKENLCGLINCCSLTACGRETNPRQVSGEGRRVEGVVQQEFKSLRVYSSGAVQQGPPGRLLPRQVLGRPQHWDQRWGILLLRRHHQVSFANY